MVKAGGGTGERTSHAVHRSMLVSRRRSTKKVTACKHLTVHVTTATNVTLRRTGSVQYQCVDNEMHTNRFPFYSFFFSFSFFFVVVVFVVVVVLFFVSFLFLSHKKKKKNRLWLLVSTGFRMAWLVPHSRRTVGCRNEWKQW